MKKYIPVIIVFVFIGIVYLLLAQYAGQIIISFIEGRAKVKIEYQNLQGNLLEGYRAEKLKIKVSPNDSIWAERFEIRYKLLPLITQKASVIEVMLVEPHLLLHEKKELKPATPTIITLAFNLLIEIKQGHVTYISKDTISVTDIIGITQISPQGGRYHIYFNNLACKIPKRNWSLNSLNGKLRIAKNRVDFDHIRLNATGIEFAGSGTYHLQEQLISLAIDRSQINFKRFLKDIEGVGEIKGNITYQNKKVWGAGQVEIFNLRPVNNQLLCVDYAFGSFRAQEDSIKILLEKAGLGKCRFDGEINISQLRNYNFHIFLDSLNLNELSQSLPPFLTKGEVIYDAGSLRGKIISYNEGLDSVKFSAEVADNSVSIDTLQAYNQQGKIFLRGNVLPALNLFAEADKFPLDILRNFQVTGLSGLLSGSWAVTGTLKAPAMAGRISLTDLDVGGYLKAQELVSEFKAPCIPEKIDIISLRAGGVNLAGVKIDSTNLQMVNNSFILKVKLSDQRHLNIRGELAEQLSGRVDDITGLLNGVAVKSLRPVAFNIRQKTVDQIELSIGQGRIKAQLTSLKRILILDQIQLNEISEIFNGPQITGVVSGRLDNEFFTFKAKEIEAFNLVRKGALTISGQIKEKAFFLDTFLLVSADSSGMRLSGTVNPNLIDLEAEFYNLGLEVFAFLDKIFEREKGRVEGKLRITGTPAKPLFKGRTKISDADFTVRFTESPIKNAHGSLVFDGRRLIFDNIQGTCGKGWAKVQGYLQLDERFKMSDLELIITFEDCLASYRPIVYGIASGKLKILAHKGMTDYNGDFKIKEAILPVGFGGTSTVKKNEEGKSGTKTRLNMKFVMERNVWLKNDLADIELAGEIFLMKGTGDPYLSGELHSRRGNVYYLDHILKVTEGKVIFTSESEINPIIDIKSEMMARGNVKIIFQITGTLRYPIFEYYTDNAEWSEQDIITYLNLNMTWQELQEYQQREVLGNVLPRRIFEYIEAGASRQLKKLTGLDYFSFETPLFSTTNEAKVTVGKYISPNLFITYTHDVFSFAQDAFSVEYIFDNRNELLIKKTSDNIYSLEYQFRIRY